MPSGEGKAFDQTANSVPEDWEGSSKTREGNSKSREGRDKTERGERERGEITRDQGAGGRLRMFSVRHKTGRKEAFIFFKKSLEAIFNKSVHCTLHQPETFSTRLA